MDGLRLSLRFFRKVPGCHGCRCPGCGDPWRHDAQRDRWAICLDGPVPEESTPLVCDDCIAYHAPELIPARAAAQALYHQLLWAREDRERRLDDDGNLGPEIEVPF